MEIHSIKLPDVGEGIAEAELVEWGVKIGDSVREDDILAAVMTDKATVEIPSDVEGKVVWLGAEIGQMIAIGSDLVRLEVEDGAGTGGVEQAVKAPVAPTGGEPASPPKRSTALTEPVDSLPARDAAPARPEGQKPLASPAVRLRAREAGADLRRVHGSGPGGRISHEDLDAWFQQADAPDERRGPVADMGVNEIKVVGLRRKIAERMTKANSRIPHITIIEEVDVTELEDLRARLNAEKEGAKARLTLLSLLMKGLVRAVGEHPGVNALYDDEAGIIRQYGGVHVGIATQTPKGLMVPVLRHVEALGLWQTAAELVRLTEAARNAKVARQELTGSTITITSLGALGAVATTPIINHPEVAIIGVNKITVRPVWDKSQFVPRKMMNLSCSFDHRIVDGWDAAVFVQRLKTLLENPAMIFVDK